MNLLDFIGKALGESQPASLLGKPEPAHGPMSVQSLLDVYALSQIPGVSDVAGLLADAKRMYDNPAERTPMNVGLASLGLLPFVPGLGAIKVFHGSPHKFDKFDSAHIGRGEGAQAFGHGGYWAESPGVAKSYAEKLAQQGKDWRTAKDITESVARGDSGRIDFLASKGTWKNEELNAMRSIASDPDYLKLSGKAREQKFWELWDKKTRTGNLYEASLRWPDAAREARDPLGPHHFLDWDKPLSEQSKQVQDSMNSLLSGIFDNGYQKTGAELLKDLQDRGVPMHGRHLYNKIGTWSKSSEDEISSMLKNSGIPGITYLDAGSRAAGEGTRNYVTFSDDLIELLKRNGENLKTGLLDTPSINVKQLESRFPNVKFDVSQNGNRAVLNRVVVPEAERGKGIGSAFMRDLTQQADMNGITLALSPSSDFGGNKSKLIDFYKRFGFKPNKGKSIDLSISETMIRTPNP